MDEQFSEHKDDNHLSSPIISIAEHSDPTIKKHRIWTVLKILNIIVLAPLIFIRTDSGALYFLAVGWIPVVIVILLDIPALAIYVYKNIKGTGARSLTKVLISLGLLTIIVISIVMNFVLN